MELIAEQRADAVFRALADPTRRRILSLLRARNHTVGELATNFPSSRPAISKHLRQLRGAGLVTSRREGTANVCQLNPVPLRAVDDWLSEYEELWMASLRGLKRHVESHNREKTD